MAWAPVAQGTEKILARAGVEAINFSFMKNAGSNGATRRIVLSVVKRPPASDDQVLTRLSFFIIQDGDGNALDASDCALELQESDVICDVRVVVLGVREYLGHSDHVSTLWVVVTGVQVLSWLFPNGCGQPMPPGRDEIFVWVRVLEAVRRSKHPIVPN